MKRVIIVHQWMAGARGDWRPWLKTELEKLGYEVLLPDMPHIESPVIEKWVGHLSDVVGIPDRDTYFIGHSIGCQTILRYLESVKNPIGGALFVAGWFDLKNLEDEEVAKIARPWTETPVSIDKIRQVLPRSTLVISDNDPYGAFEENKNRFAELGSKIVVLHNTGHITEEDGFIEAPVVMNEFRELAGE